MQIVFDYLDIISQVMIPITGISAVWLSQSSDPAYRKYAPVLGLVGEPFWLSSAIIHSQWGIFVLGLFYTFAWGRGFWIQWIKTSGAA